LLLICGVQSEKNERRKRADFGCYDAKKQNKRKQKCTCTIQFIPFITLKSVRYNHSLSIKCLEWDSEVPSPGSHSWWKPCGWSSHNITLLYTTSRGNSWTALVMDNSAATKEADSCVIVIVNKNKTLQWTQFCLFDASTEMTNFWILLSDRIFKPSHNTLQYLKSLFFSKLYLIRQNEKTKTAIISGKVGPNISANQ